MSCPPWEYNPRFLLGRQALYRCDHHRATSRKHCSNVLHILKELDISNFAELADQELIYSFIDQHVKRGIWKASTAKLYFSSIIYSILYLVDKAPEVMTEEERYACQNLAYKVTFWRTSYRGIVKTRKFDLWHSPKTAFTQQRRCQEISGIGRIKIR